MNRTHKYKYKESLKIYAVLVKILCYLRLEYDNAYLLVLFVSNFTSKLILFNKTLINFNIISNQEYNLFYSMRFNIR